MIDVIEGLLNGDETYPAAFRSAKSFWDKFFEENAETDDLQAAIEVAQMRFQWAMEKVGLVAPLAKEIMAVTCVGSLYNDGFEDRELARRVIEIMRTSKTLSLGIGSSAQDVGRLYGL